MNSALLALFTRALREDVRSKSMYWARAGLVGIVLLNLGTTQLTMGWAGAPGLVFFNSIVGINLFFVSLAGLSYFSSAITEEKEDMTLGLLRMTNLNPLSILLGKSASRQIGALLLLLSQVPFTLLAVALGGVTLAQIIAAYTCLAAYTLLLGNVALFFSVMMRRSVTAAILTFGVMFVFLFGSWIVRNPVLYLLAFFKIIPAELPPSWIESFLQRWQQASPLTRLDEIGITGFRDGPFCFQVITNVLLGVAFFLGAWAIFEVFCSEQADAAPPRPLLSRSGKRFRLFSPGRPWRRALFWKDFHFIGGGHIGAVGKLVTYGALFLLPIFLATNAFDTTKSPFVWKEIGYTTMWCSLLVFLAEVAFISARVFRQERVWKTWSSLSMLPMSTRRIAWQKIGGCLLATWPVWLFGAFGALLVAEDLMKGLGEIFNASNRAGNDWEWMAITGFAFAILLLVFFYHLVIVLSLRLKWGALPLAFAITFVGTQMGVMMAFFMFQGVAFIVLDVALGTAIVLLHHHIGKRLEQLAAED
ncbi:MAG: hypothetical protein ABIZ56_09775 [Chthoniobacteraceae bacterium]